MEYNKLQFTQELTQEELFYSIYMFCSTNFGD